MVFDLHAQVSVLFGESRYLILIGVSSVFGGEHLLSELPYLLGLVVECLVLLVDALRIVFFNFEVCIKRLLLVVYHHVKPLHLGLVGIMLHKFRFSIVLTFAAREGEMKNDVSHKP